MTFLAQSASKALLKLQLSHLKYEKLIATSRLNAMNREIEAIDEENESSENSVSDSEYKKEPYYQWLKRQSDKFQIQQNNLDDEITLLNEEITSLNTMVTNGIKSSCQFTISGG